MTNSEHISKLRSDLKTKFSNITTYKELKFENVLIIDDDEICISITKNTIHNYNFSDNVTIVSDINLAMNILSNTRFDIIFANLELVVIENKSYIKELKQYTDRLVCMTPDALLDDSIMYGKNCVFINKPLKIQTLRTIL